MTPKFQQPREGNDDGTKKEARAQGTTREPRSKGVWMTVCGLAVATALLVGGCEDQQHPVACGAIPEVRVHIGETAAAQACFEDANGDPLTYSAQSGNPGIATATMSGNTVTITAVAQGQTTISVTASDPGGLTGTSEIRVVVPNRSPVPQGEMPGVAIRVGREAILSRLESFFADPDGDALTYTATSSDSEVATAAVDGTSLTIAGVAAGSATITVTATDAGGLSATQQASATIEANRAPLPVGTIPDQTKLATGTEVTITVSDFFIDPDGDALTYTATSSDSEVATVAVEGTSLTIAGVAAGNATITVTATDAGGLSATQQAGVTVEANRAPLPVGTIPDQTTLAPGAEVTITVSGFFIDPDGDALTYTATSSDSEVAMAAIAGTSLTITGVAAGSATITVTATDPGGLSATQAFLAAMHSSDLRVFRDDFTEPLLNTVDWELSHAEARVDNGILELTSVRNEFPNVGAVKRLYKDGSLGVLGDWTISVKMGRVATQDPHDVLIRVESWDGTCLRWFPCYPGFGFFIGSGVGGGDNYALAVWEWSERGARWLTLDGSQGESDAVNDASGELTEITLTFDDGRIVALAGTTELFDVDVSKDPALAEGISSIATVWLGTRADEESATALFDWIQIAGRRWEKPQGNARVRPG